MEFIQVYFGKCCSGKSTLLGKSALEVDKALWEHYKGDPTLVKQAFKLAFYAKNKESYRQLIHQIGQNVDWKALFSRSSIIDFPVIGVYWNHIPEHIKEKLRLTYVYTTIENRKKFSEYRKTDPRLIKCSDFFFEYPPYYHDSIEVKHV